MSALLYSAMQGYEGNSMIRPGTYRHYKGQFYNVIGIGRHSESLEKYVVYQALYGDYALWVRPESMFYETVEVNGESVPRFTLVSESNAHLAAPEKAEDI